MVAVAHRVVRAAVDVRIDAPARRQADDLGPTEQRVLLEGKILQEAARQRIELGARGPAAFVHVAAFALADGGLAQPAQGNGEGFALYRDFVLTAGRAFPGAIDQRDLIQERLRVDSRFDAPEVLHGGFPPGLRSRKQYACRKNLTD